MHARARRPVPPRRARQAGAPARQVQGLRLSQDAILTLNAGSSSIKYALFARDGATAGARLRAGQIEGLGGAGLTHGEALAQVVAQLGDARVAAVGHRIVHGGVRFAHPELVDDAVFGAIAALEALAPLHQPHNVDGVRAARAAFPGVPQVACFDTAFHRTMPEVQQRFAIPRALHDAGVRRYGFHGLSYESIALQLAGIDPGRAAGRVVVAHLGNGASMCALSGGRSLATTMSFSPLDGLVMGTRCGRIDAAVVLHLLVRMGWSTDAVERLLHRESGLLGLSGLASDMRALLASPEPAAAFAIDAFVEAAARELAIMAAALRGIDLLVFTGGIGQNAHAVRARIVEAAAWLGLALDADANARGAAVISTPASAVPVRVVATDEEAVIARHTAAMLG